MSGWRIGASILVAGLVALLEARAALATIVATLEEPIDGGTCSGVSTIHGWAFSTTGATLVSPFQVKLDDADAIEVPCCSSRADVRSQFPTAPVRTGFSGIFNWGLLAPGSHRVDVTITSATGETATRSATCTAERAGQPTFLQDLDIDNQGAGDCVNIGRDLCCDGVLATGSRNGQSDVERCDNVCYRWEKASQSLVLTSAMCTAE